MKEEDLEKTIPIETLGDLEVYQKQHRATRSENVNIDTSRSEKYKDTLDGMSDEDLGEAAEEALAEKNIAMAEAILSEEKRRTENENKAEVKEKKDDDKDIDPKINKKLKIIIFTLIGVAVLAIIILVLFLVFKKDKKEDVLPPSKPDQSNVVETPPVVIDNYYYKDGTLYLLNDKEEEIGSYECTNKDSSLCYVAFNKYQDGFDVDLLIDEKGDAKTQRLPIYGENYVFVSDNVNNDSTNIVMYSLKDNKVIDTYLDVKAYSDNYVIVENTNKKYGLIQVNDTIKEVIKPQYSYMGMIDGETNIIVKNSKGYVVINKSNKELSKPIDSSLNVKDYNDKLIVTENDDLYSVLNYEGEVLANGYKYATVLDKYMALVKDKKLYIKDVDGLKYNQEGINLKNINYIKKYVYNEDGKLKETLGSFNINIKDNSVEVVVYDRTTTGGSYNQLDIATVLVNKKYNYLNYFNGKLYFYSDKEKNNLLGTYSCNNKNSIESADDKLTSCLPANDTIYEDNELVSDENKTRKSTIPLINNKYVFISDGKDNVYLYNLIDKSIDGSYKTVNTYTKNNDYTFDSYTGKLNVIALNQKGYYGMINITGEVGTKVYDFAYKKMEKFGDYVLVQTSDDKWKIIYSASSSSSLYPAKIVNYTSDKKYFKLKDDKGLYSIYDALGKNVSTDVYKTLIMYNLYYLGINTDSELYLYDYTGKAITTHAIMVNNTCSLSDQVKSSYKDGQYLISVCNNDKYDEYVFDVKSNDFL